MPKISLVDVTNNYPNRECPDCDSDVKVLEDPEEQGFVVIECPTHARMILDLDDDMLYRIPVRMKPMPPLS